LEAVTITLNGQEVSGHSGMTVLELARESGVDIPTLCHDSHLAPVGACRICIVEDERSGKLLASCVTPIASGMVINTSSPRVIEHRKTIVKLMLASHPDSCLVCDKGNRCQLRQIAADMGIGLIDFQRIPQGASIEEVNPFIQRDLSKCILCAKCIRACQELVVEGAIDYFERGFIAKAATLDDLPLEASECTFCGTCVAMCPTGALMEKERTYRGTSRTIIETTCPFCGCGCSICLEVKDNHIVRATPGKENSANDGTLCVRGSYGYDFIYSPDRLTSPLVKTNEGFTELSWEEALERVANQFKQIKDKHGPESLAVLGSSKCTNEENYLLQRFTRCVLGTNNIDNGTRLNGSANPIIPDSAAGLTGFTNSLSALEQSEVIIVIGADVNSSAPIIGYAIKRAVKYKGTKLVLIDPRRIKLASFAHLWLRPKVGTDIALLNSLAKVIIDEGLLDEKFIAEKTDDFETLAKTLNKYSPDYVANIVGVTSEDIRTAARLYAQANQASIVYGTGITQYIGGADSVRILINLMILTGHTSHRGSGIYAIQKENNGQGACDMGALPDLLPGYQSVTDDQARRNFEEHWGVSLPANPGLTAVEIIKQAKEGKIKGLYIIGENPILAFPDTNLVTEALTTLDFLVVQDMFLTETARQANIVLPASSFAEKEGTFTNFEGRVNTVQKAIEPIGESLPDWEIILRLADKMGYPLPFSSVQQVADEISELLPSYKSLTGSENAGQSNFTCFFPVEYNPPVKNPEGTYPFTLLTGTTLNHFGTGTRSSRSSRLKKFSPEAFLEISVPDAQKLAIADSNKVRVISPAGELTVRVKITDTLPEGILFIPACFPETPVNRLFDVVLDPETKTPSLKACSVMVERAETNG